MHALFHDNTFSMMAIGPYASFYASEVAASDAVEWDLLPLETILQ